MGVAYNPKIVTNGLVMALDASNVKSVPKTNLLTTWADYGGNQANYEILGPYSIKLKNTTTGWVGNFPAAVSSTGKYIITFTYYSDSDGSSLVLDNDGIMDNAYNTTLTANINPQTYTGSVDVNTTGNIIHFFRRNGGGNIYVTNVSYFKLETTWTDLSGNGNNGTLTNGPTYSNANGGSIVFDAVDDYVTVPHNSNINLVDTVSLEAWVKYTTTINTVLIEKSNNNTHYQLQIFAGYQGSPGIDGQLVFMLQPSSNDWVVSGIITNNGNWHHVVGTYDRGVTTAKIYVNGILRNTNSSILTGPTTNAQPLLIGSRSGASGFGGSISGVKIYNRVLSAAEVQQNFNATRGRYGI